MVRRVLAAGGTLALLAAVGMVGAHPAAADAVRAGEWWLGSPMNITQAWTISQGAGVKVALIDGGVDGTHPDLAGALADGTDVSGKGTPDGLTPLPGPEPQHGTGMAVFIAGRGHGAVNADGLIGVAPQASILSISMSFDVPFDPSQGAPAIRWAVDHGAKVINMSIGGTSPDAADIAYAQQHDVVLVGAAGNDGGPGVEDPAGLRGVVSVGGIDQDVTLDPTSNYGGPIRSDNVTSTGVAVVAPDSTGPAGKPGLPQATLVSKGSYYTNYGTSGSTAFVSGVVALIRAKFPTMNAANVVNRLIMTAHKITTDTYSPQFGFGVPDAYAALTANIPTVCENPLGSEATNSSGIWPSIVDKTTYHPTCDGSPRPAPTTAASDPSNNTVGSGAITTTAKSSSTTSVFVGIAATLVVLVVVIAIIFSRRGNRPAQPQPPPSYYPPPPPPQP